MKKKYIYMDEIGHLPANGWSVKKKEEKTVRKGINDFTPQIKVIHVTFLLTINKKYIVKKGHLLKLLLKTLRCEGCIY